MIPFNRLLMHLMGVMLSRYNNWKQSIPRMACRPMLMLCCALCMLVGVQIVLRLSRFYHHLEARNQRSTM
jgi:hypothetical protein